MSDVTGVRLVDLPALGAVTDASKVAGCNTGAGLFSVPALKAYFNDGQALTVRNFGAVGDGVADDVLAFEEAASLSTEVIVPTGNYHLSRPVNVIGRDIMWMLAQDATIVEGADKLNGGIIRPNRINRRTFGTYSEGASFGISGLRGDARPGVTGFNTDSDQAGYSTRDSVALYADNEVPPPALVSTGSATYSATSATSTAAADVTQLRVDMFVLTKHVPFYSGRLVSWSSDGKTFNVSGWYAQGNTASGQVPAGGTGFSVVWSTAAWALNSNIFVFPDSAGQTGTGYEIGLFQDAAPFNPTTQTPNVTGVSVVELGTYGGAVAYLQRGQSYNGYASAGARQNGFLVYDNASHGNGPYSAPVSGFRCEALTSPFVYVPQGVPTWSVGNNGQMDIGSTSAGGSVGIDLHVLPDNPASPRDYDIRLLGVNNGAGGADLFIQGAAAVHSPGINPLVTGSMNLGGPSFVWGDAWMTNLNLLGGLAADGNIATSAGSIIAAAGPVEGTSIVATAGGISATSDISSSGGSLIAANNIQAGTTAGGYVCKAGRVGAFSASDFNLYWTGSVMQLWVDATNLGTITTTSDLQYKHAVEPVTESGLDRISRMLPIRFRYADKGVFRDDGVIREGFVAQDIIAIVPSAVEGALNGDQPLSLNPMPLIATLVKAVQELTARVVSLEALVPVVPPVSSGA